MVLDQKNIIAQRRKRYNPFAVFPLSLLVEILIFAGRVGEGLRRHASMRAVAINQIPQAIPVPEAIPVDTAIGPLEGGSPNVKQRSTTLVLFETASVENTELRDEIAKLRQENADLKKQSAVLEPQRPDGHSEGMQKSRRMTERAIARLLEPFLPHISFEPGSLHFLLNEAHNMDQTIRRLRELNDNPGGLRGERIESSPGWIEVKYGKDGSTEDRLYYKHESDTGKSSVRLSKKQLQRHDFRRFR